MAVRRLAVVLAVLAVAGGAAALTGAASPRADYLACLAPVRSVWWSNVQAGRADLAGDVGHATAVADGRTAATYLNAAVDILDKGP